MCPPVRSVCVRRGGSCPHSNVVARALPRPPPQADNSLPPKLLPWLSDCNYSYGGDIVSAVRGPGCLVWRRLGKCVCERRGAILTGGSQLVHHCVTTTTPPAVVIRSAAHLTSLPAVVTISIARAGRCLLLGRHKHHASIWSTSYAPPACGGGGVVTVAAAAAWRGVGAHVAGGRAGGPAGGGVAAG